MKKSVIFALLPVILGGCSLFLPSGDPPEGNILNNTPQNNTASLRKPSEAIDYLISALTMALLEKCPGTKVRLGTDHASANMAFKILHESGKITGNTMTYADTDWVFKSALSGNDLSVSLEHKGVSVWGESVKLAMP